MQELEYEKGEPLHALDRNQLIRLFRGFGHVEGGAAELVGDQTIRVPTPWTAYVNASLVSVESPTDEVELPPADADRPRYDLVYVDTDGALAVESGEPAELIGEPPHKVRNPAPPSTRGLVGTVIAAVYRRADETTVATENILDRRFSSEILFNVFSVERGFVAEPPEDDGDIARKAETDALDEAKVDWPVVADDIQDGEVVTAKIADGAVVTAKIDGDAVGVEQLKAALGTTESEPVTGETFVENVTADTIKPAERLAIPNVADDDEVPNDTMFYNTIDAQQKYKDENGDIVAAEQRTLEEISRLSSIYSEALFPEVFG